MIRSEKHPPARVVIEQVSPEVDGGRFPIKRVEGESVRVRAKVFSEGHDRLCAVLRHRRGGEERWHELAMQGLPNDGFEASFVVGAPGRHEYTLEAWVDRFGSWRGGLAKKVEAGIEVESELLEGAVLVEQAARRAAEGASDEDASWLVQRARELRGPEDTPARAELALSAALSEAMARHPDRTRAAALGRVLGVQIESERARTGSWYELFPRSCASEPGAHGSLRDCADRLDYVASMGFDVVYLPPIHPIGRTHRKGPNNSTVAGQDDPGSPWAIGSEEGGHKAVHPALGSLADFDRLVERARDLGLEIALDIAFQCSPDHPYVEKHPEWFRHRPDGTIQYAENPPKKYQDILPLDFEGEGWRELWQELASVVFFWIDHGVRIFRVDNPHTKPFAFWEWLIHEVRSRYPDVVFLSEAFTRPSVMQYLAKVGFSQSYTYFTWRNTKHEIEEYFRELAHPPVSDFMRGNLFANTPDILPEFLQIGRRAAFQARATLAATLSSAWGIYGPVFELCVSQALPGTEEYRDSEKYQVSHWSLDDPWSLRGYLQRLNAIRRENRALTEGRGPEFYPTDNRELVAYGRSTLDGSETVVVVVNLDPHHVQSGWITLPVPDLGLDLERPFQVHDLLGGARYLWHGPRNFVSIDPDAAPAHVFRLRRRVRTERDFDYFL
ncbi:MAG: alpha-1,4-glucan--maltose-1-phosphate maltosyltransferase [Myxococcota bacterium]|nr:alpha-1,4-glucan--maltose-1-phosphate maltosyltransferase [Myxococcota bacterium]